MSASLTQKLAPIDMHSWITFFLTSKGASLACTSDVFCCKNQLNGIVGGTSHKACQSFHVLYTLPYYFSVLFIFIFSFTL